MSDTTHVQYQDQRRSYCGRDLGTFEFTITSPEHAYDCVKTESTVQPCPKCVASIKSAGLWPAPEAISVKYLAVGDLIQLLQGLPAEQPILIESAAEAGDLVYDVVLQHDTARKIVLLLPRTAMLGDAQVIGEAWEGQAEP